MNDRADRLAESVRARRRVLGLRQDELADLAGVSTRSVHAIEQGKSTVRMDILMLVLTALGWQLRVVGPGIDITIAEQ
jgi:HTH-type transcriptional regulator / antitoxin HipB